jgi:hypothetical protein
MMPPVAVAPEIHLNNDEIEQLRQSIPIEEQI